MGGRWRDVGLALLSVATLALAVLVLRPPPAPEGADSLATASEAPSPLTRPGRARPVVVVFGDSYAAGIGATDPVQDGYVRGLERSLGWTVISRAAPGGGYVSGGYDGPMINLLRRIDLARVDPDLVVLQAGHNDVTASPDTVRVRAVEVIRAVRASVPRARVVVVGVLWPGKPPASAEATDGALQDAARAESALFSYTFDLRFPAVGGLRPTDQGYRDIALRLRSSFSDLGLVAQPAQP